MMRLLLGIIIGVFLCLKVSFVHDLGNRAWDSVFGGNTTEQPYYTGHKESDDAVNSFIAERK